MDTLSRGERSERMGRVRSRNTKPEMFVRKLIHGMGYRYRLHAGDLPGRPDIVFRSRKKAIFVHGCFWHRHPNCKLARMPKTRKKFWSSKLEGNRVRDKYNQKELTKAGWRYLLIWECELKDKDKISKSVESFLLNPTGESVK